MDTDSRQAEGLTPHEVAPPGAPPRETAPRENAPPGARPILAPPRKRRSLASTLVWALVFILVVAGVVWFASTRGAGGGQGAAGGHGRHGGGKGGAMGDMATTVSVAQVSRGDVPIYLNQLGTVTPLATVTVRSEIAGYLQQIAFTEGQMVSKGQFLAQVDPRPYQAALMQAQGTYARDQAALASAQLDLKRYQLLLSQDSIASQTVDQQAATVLGDKGTLKTDEATIAADKQNLAYTHITSPVTGRVGLRQVDIGNYVSTGDTNGIVIVTQLTPMDVLFTLPEDNLPQVQARIHTGASLPVVAYDRTGQTELAAGRLLTLDNQVDPTTGTVKAKARFDNGAGTLFPQQFVNVRVLVDTLKGRRGRAEHRHPARRQRPLCLCGAGRGEPPHRHRARREDRRHRRDQHRHPQRAAARRDGGDRRHRPPARGRGCDPARRLHPRFRRRSGRPRRPSPPWRRGYGRRGGGRPGGWTALRRLSARRDA